MEQDKEARHEVVVELDRDGGEKVAGSEAEVELETKVGKNQDRR